MKVMLIKPLPEKIWTQNQRFNKQYSPGDVFEVIQYPVPHDFNVYKIKLSNDELPIAKDEVDCFKELLDD